MNRAERRRQEKAQLKAQKEKTYTLTQCQIDKMKHDIYAEAVDVAFALMLQIPTNILSRCYWEKSAKRKIPIFIDECISLYDSIGASAVDYSDIMEDISKCVGNNIDIISKIKNYRTTSKTNIA